jgi:hypothetical protein
LELERRQIRRKEVGMEGVMGLIRDFAVDLGIWKEGRGRTWWSVMLVVCWDAGVARVGGVRARVIDKV